MSTLSTESEVFTVSQLTYHIKQTLEGRFGTVLLQGEISNLKEQSSGHLYFSLKDAGAQISAVMFRGNSSKLLRLPKDGDQVVATGDLSVYAPRGNYQLVISALQIKGLGDLLLRLEELKREIHRRGWFAQHHKKALPKFPKTIGVVTSPTGAVIQDILNVLSTRFSGFHLILYPVKVQGTGAAEEIATAIREINLHKLADVLIIGRGGGTIEDLWAFNEEIVAKAIFESVIPVVSAVGHETDHCIADYVADARAPTPSAAAQMVIAEKEHELHKLETSQKRLFQVMSQLLRRQRVRLEGLCRQPAFASPYTLLGPAIQRLDDLRSDLDQSIKGFIREKLLILKGMQAQNRALNPLVRVRHYQHRLLQWNLNLNQTIEQQIKHRRQRFNKEALERQALLRWQRIFKKKREDLESVVRGLKSIDPKNLLQKGYSIVFSEDRERIVTTTEGLSAGDKVYIRLSEGGVLSEIKHVFNSGGA